MSLDELDKDYLNKLAEKTIAEMPKGKVVTQLCEADFLKWNGVNIQGHGLDKPDENETDLALYIIDVDKKLSKRFRVTKTVALLASRGTTQIIYGTSDPEGKQTKIIIKWEKEQRI